MLEGLPTASREALLSAARLEHVEGRRPLVLCGAVIDRCWLLVEGHVKEHRRLLDGSEVVTGVRGPGDLVADAAALAGAPSIVDVSTIDAVTAQSLDAQRLRAAMSSDPAIGEAVHRAVTHRADELQRSLVRLGHHDTVERVVLTLLDLAGRFGSDVPTGRCLGVPLTQAELASWAQMSRESFAKALRQLRRRGLVVTSRCEIVLPDVEALAALPR